VAAEVNQSIAPNPAPAEETAVEMSADHLLPLASDLQNDQAAVEPEVWDVPVGTPSRLVIPAISLDSGIAPVGRSPVVISGVAYGQWNTSDNQVGWHDRSARLGSSGNTVLNGHSDVNAAVFRNLRFVEIGDKITVLSRDQDYHYRVTHKFLVQEKDVPLEERIRNAVWVGPTQDNRLTLITCANPGATHRLILIAQP
jgi:LPXTG-site transpeptidase (sortase) family protein